MHNNKPIALNAIKYKDKGVIFFILKEYFCLKLNKFQYRENWSFPKKYNHINENIA